MDLQLAGRRAVVTGGSRGIGFAVGRALAQEGAAVALVSRNAESVAAQATRLSAETGAQVIGVAADTADDGSVTAMAETVIARLGGVDILVNNAAPVMSAVSGEDQLEEQINVKVRGYLRCVRAFTPGMTERRWGRVINVAGLAARQAVSVTGSIRNVAIAAMTRNLADELGPRGVNVTVVHPGATRTEAMQWAVQQQAEATGRSLEEIERRYADSISIGRVIEPAEVASVVAFLASPLSVAINGDAVCVGGGAKGAIHY
ncbi:SDR family NAD(P)-dependent oxidoreductase [Kutzneria kofuensis]|uniref:NAD(P)-dependent dehydrogenase (Short-subunit alcohol dehydrogenase family) n=1 Tax=Kutzneria kofuensis TaxID=103725 RepID=A0A7W9KP44_9PSEU|nr:SDR family oxidoreductase [Kutzneria kofuensis]MBB5896050.1 NAD(P)-dependent dehydrogenase (short-subunit alcohol dehydrogenase family) [Kutzneria kofuensis]